MGMTEHAFDSEEHGEQHRPATPREVDTALRSLRDVLGRLDPALLTGPDAARLTRTTALGERLCATAKARLATRTQETGSWRGGRAASVEQWLAETTGSSEHVAREELATIGRLASLPTTEAMVHAGSLSLAQAALVSAGAAVDPASEERLLRAAERSGMRGLRAEKERVVAAATDEVAAATRAHRGRHLRTWQRGAATHGSFSGPTSEVADLLEALEPLTKNRFEAARSAGADQRESLDAYRFDALIDLARAGGPATAPCRPTHVARVRVDLAALLRGRTEAGEICEIPGVGPVPVAHARDVLAHGLLQLVITNGVDVQTVVSTTRHVPAPLKIAIAERDPVCRIRGCDRSTNLHCHHTTPFARSRRTMYLELGNLCSRHHHLVHDEGYEIVVDPDGAWDLRAAPAHQAERPAAAGDRAPPDQAAA